MRRTLMASVVGVLLLVGAGYAFADTQSPTQGVDAGQAMLQTAIASLLDAANGDNRPDGANGLESEFPQPDPRFVEGPAGGLVKNGPFE
jgi:hypothetical protein